MSLELLCDQEETREEEVEVEGEVVLGGDEDRARVARSLVADRLVRQVGHGGRQPEVAEEVFRVVEETPQHLVVIVSVPDRVGAKQFFLWSVSPLSHCSEVVLLSHSFAPKDGEKVDCWKKKNKLQKAEKSPEEVCFGGDDEDEVEDDGADEHQEG